MLPPTWKSDVYPPSWCILSVVTIHLVTDTPTHYILEMKTCCEIAMTIYVYCLEINEMYSESTLPNAMFWKVGLTKKKSALFLPIGWHFWVPGHFECILPKGPYPPCLRMADRALLAGYPRFLLTNSLGGDYWSFVRKFIHSGFFFLQKYLLIFLITLIFYGC